MKSIENRPQAAPAFVSTALCKDISLSVLLGQDKGREKLPEGWDLCTSIEMQSKTDCYVFLVRSREWVQATYHDYWKGFAEVKIGDRIVKVFSKEHLAIRLTK